MIKNGRPYTTENGFIDGALLSDHEDEVIAVVNDWIGKNVRAGERCSMDARAMA